MNALAANLIEHERHGLHAELLVLGELGALLGRWPHQVFRRRGVILVDVAQQANDVPELVCGVRRFVARPCLRLTVDDSRPQRVPDAIGAQDRLQRLTADFAFGGAHFDADHAGPRCLDYLGTNADDCTGFDHQGLMTRGLAVDLDRGSAPEHEHEKQQGSAGHGRSLPQPPEAT